MCLFFSQLITTVHYKYIYSQVLKLMYVVYLIVVMRSNTTLHFILTMLHNNKTMQRSASQSSSASVLYFCSCGMVYHKQEVRCLLSLLVRLLPYNHNPNPLD